MTATVPVPVVALTNSAGQQVDITQWVATFNPKSGRQHELDRVESGTVTLRVDNRDGRFSPWNTNTYTWNLVGGGTTTTSPLTINAPLTITASWSGTTYPVFIGNVDLIEPIPVNELDDDVTIQASDALKRMALRRLLDGDVYPNQIMADATRSTGTTSLSASAAVGATSLTLATPFPSPSTSGDTVLIIDGQYTEAVQIAAGWTAGTNPVPLNYKTKYAHASGTTVNDASGYANLLTTNNKPYGHFYRLNDQAENPQAAKPTVNYALDTWKNGHAPVYGSVAFGQPGSRIYDPDMAADLSNGTGAGTGFICAPPYQKSFSGLTGFYGYWTQECWVLSPNTGDYVFSNYDAANHSAVAVQISSGGQAQVVQHVMGSSSTTTTYPTGVAGPTGVNIKDGRWHLITLQNYGGSITLYVDGQSVATGTLGTTCNADAAAWGAFVSGTSALTLPFYSCAGVVDECVFVWDFLNYYGPNAKERFRKGQLLTRAKSSGQKIAEALQVAGFIPNVAPATTTINTTGTTGASTTLTVASTSGFPVPGMVQVNSNYGTCIFTYTGTTSTTFTNVSCQQGSPSWAISNTATVTQLPLVNATTNIDNGYVRCIGDTTQTTQTACLDFILNVVQTEEGFFYQDPSGVLQFKNRFYCQETPAKQISSAAVNISDNASTATALYKFASPEILVDDLDLWNRAELTDLAGFVTEIGNPSSIALYGARTVPKSSVYTSTTIDTLALGQMLLNKFKTPLPRVQKLEMSSSAGVAKTTQIPTMLGLNLWDQVTFSRAGIGSSRYTAQMVVESIQHTWNSDPGEWVTLLVLSPYEMVMGSSTVNSASVFQLGGSTFQGTTTTTIMGTGMSTASTTLQVSSTAGFPKQGQIGVNSGGTVYTFNYTGTTGTTFTNCYSIGQTGGSITGGSTVTSNTNTGSQDTFGG